MTSEYSTYEEYLRHPKFRAIRKEAMICAGYRCLDCGDSATEVHHKKYPKWGEFDEVINLVPLCHSCHSKRHGKEN